jgi:hypothetical protein
VIPLNRDSQDRDQQGLERDGQPADQYALLEAGFSSVTRQFLLDRPGVVSSPIDRRMTPSTAAGGAGRHPTGVLSNTSPGQACFAGRGRSRQAAIKPC